MNHKLNLLSGPIPKLVKTIAIPMIPLYLYFIPKISGDIARQIANTHTAFNIINAIIFLPDNVQRRGHFFCRSRIHAGSRSAITVFSCFLHYYCFGKRHRDGFFCAHRKRFRKKRCKPGQNLRCAGSLFRSNIITNTHYCGFADFPLAFQIFGC